MKSTIRRHYKDYVFHYSRIWGSYMIFHTSQYANGGYFLLDRELNTIKETKKYIEFLIEYNDKIGAKHVQNVQGS